MPRIDSKTRKVPYVQAFLQTTKHKAMNGDPTSAKIIMELMKLLGMIAATPASELALPLHLPPDLPDAVDAEVLGEDVLDLRDQLDVAALRAGRRLESTLRAACVW